MIVGMGKGFSENFETGDRVKNDQTVTLRVYHAKRKVRGKLKRQCGCGRYIPEELFDDHRATCSGKAPVQRHKRKRKKRKQPQTPSAASRALLKLLGS
jgi:hypothetical protein